jgi:hypothetical protein
VHQVLIYDNTVNGNNRWNQDLYPYSGSGVPGGVNTQNSSKLNLPDGTPDIDQNIFWNDDGIHVCGSGIAVFNNTLSGFGDALCLSHGTKQVGTHFYRNEVKMSGDDGIEADYGSRNITFYDNRVTNAMTLVSCDPMWGGPFIAARNIGINIGRQVYKLNSAKDTGMFFYNNTIVRTANPKASTWVWEQPMQFWTHRAWGFENNITIHQKATQLIAIESKVQDPIDFTHNSWYPDGAVWWTESGGHFASLAAAYAGLPARTPVFSGITRRHKDDNICKLNPFVTPVVLGDTHRIEITIVYTPILADRTAPKNSGIPIVGITDGYSGVAPDRGAIISGRTLPVWGDRSE